MILSAFRVIYGMTSKTLENSRFWQKGSALWQDQV
uniref:Uncharacterized protein n=1 Tax=virus sp. ctr1v16 TaxID=2825823 RepID=A0A8S5RPX6_9VIRU|nr:MAG TPA: hypothetical protein [virus sp. ctr1v16]DAP89936.1 MAG TPA: hypothetical protein [Caudoviricetes sp.]